MYTRVVGALGAHQCTEMNEVEGWPPNSPCLNCHGHLYMGDDSGTGCCPESTWNEWAYRSIKGNTTWLYHIERLTRQNVDRWLTLEAVDNVAWDFQKTGDPRYALGNIQVSEKLLSALTTAISNFNATFQPGRWRKQSRCVLVECPDQNHWYGCWEGYEQPDQQALAAGLQRVIGHLPSRQERDGWYNNVAWPTLQSVPRYTYAMISSLPPEWGDGAWYSQPAYPIVGRFWKCDGQLRLVPADWTKSFLDVFAPGWSSTPINVGAFRTLTKRAKQKKLGLHVVVKPTDEGPEDEGPEDEGPEDERRVPRSGAVSSVSGGQVAAGVVAVAAVGAIVWLLRRRPR